ncbi:MAG: hypothetical protein U1C46_01415, partial [Bacteroidales bacterium]|nr:hypothetical protein [Bacteroidales bacterium]
QTVSSSRLKYKMLCTINFNLNGGVGPIRVSSSLRLSRYGQTKSLTGLRPVNMNFDGYSYLCVRFI